MAKKKSEVVKKKSEDAAKVPYRQITVRDLMNYVADMPLGFDTPVFSGDFECNYTHLKHEMQLSLQDGKPNAVVLAYEMHEGGLWDD